MKPIAVSTAAVSTRQRGCHSSLHECHSKHRTTRSGFPLDGFPRIYSSAIKLCAGAEAGSVGTKLWHYCSSADLSYPFLNPHPATEELSAEAITCENCMDKTPMHARGAEKGSGTGSALPNLCVPGGLLCTERRQ